jgi:hypothetical protein
MVSGYLLRDIAQTTSLAALSARPTPRRERYGYQHPKQSAITRINCRQCSFCSTGTIFAIYETALCRFSRDCRVVYHRRVGVPGGRRFRAELRRYRMLSFVIRAGIPCLRVVRRVELFRRCVAQWTQNPCSRIEALTQTGLQPVAATNHGCVDAFKRAATASAHSVLSRSATFSESTAVENRNSLRVLPLRCLGLVDRRLILRRSP